MWCFHDRLKQFTFGDGSTIKCCVDCSAFDNKRIETLRVNNVEIPKAKEQLHWRVLLEDLGLSDQLVGHPLVAIGGSLQDLAKIPNLFYLPSYFYGNFNDVLPTLKKLYDQRRIDAEKRYTLLDDKEHVERARRIPHTLTMPRALKNFCPRCLSYQTADHEVCEQNTTTRTFAERERAEQSRILRDGSITLSNPTLLAPSQILHSKGGYGKHSTT